MGIAALVLGIVAVVAAIIPGCGLFVAIPAAIVGLILGIVEVKKKSKAGQPKGMGKAGIILNVVAIVISILWVLLFAAASDEIQDAANQIQQGMQRQMQDAQQQMQEQMDQQTPPEIPDTPADTDDAPADTDDAAPAPATPPAE